MKKNKFFTLVILTLFGVAAVYFYFNVGPVHTGAPTGGSENLTFLKAELDRQEEVSDFEDGIIGVTEYALLGYRDIPSDVSIYALKYSVDFWNGPSGLEEKTASLVPVVTRKDGDEIFWESFDDASYAEDFAALPGTVREILNNGQKHNEIVKELEDKARAAAEKRLSGWTTYKNLDFGFQIDYPVGWQKGEYTLLNSGNRIIAVAFDPDKVITEQDYDSLDEAPGMVQIRLTDAIPDGSFEQRSVGADNISAGYLIETCLEPNCPNPWWLNRTSNTYYLTLPKASDNYKYLEITFQYLKEKAGDAALQESLKKILDSFKFI